MLINITEGTKPKENLQVRSDSELCQHKANYKASLYNYKYNKSALINTFICGQLGDKIRDHSDHVGVLCSLFVISLCVIRGCSHI